MIKRQMEVAFAALKALKDAGYINSAVAGGAPRDWVMGKVATDIDIYIQTPNPITIDDYIRAGFCSVSRAVTSVDDTEASNTIIESYTSCRYIRSVHNAVFMYNDIKVQLINTNSVIFNVLDTFPEICRAYITATVPVIQYTGKFLKAHADKSYTVNRSTPDYNAKLLSKFPDYTQEEVGRISTSSNVQQGIPLNLWGEDGSANAINTRPVYTPPPIPPQWRSGFNDRDSIFVSNDVVVQNIETGIDW